MSALFDLAIRRWREVRADFELVLEASYALADAECAGNLLNARGRAAGVDAYSLFYGPRVRVDAYASEELLEWFERRGRLTYADFEKAHAPELG